MSFAAENTKEGGLDDVDGVTRDSAEEDNGGEGSRASLSSLSTSGNEISEAEVLSWNDGEFVEPASCGVFMLSNESEACA